MIVTVLGLVGAEPRRLRSQQGRPGPDLARLGLDLAPFGLARICLGSRSAAALLKFRGRLVGAPFGFSPYSFVLLPDCRRLVVDLVRDPLQFAQRISALDDGP